MKKRNRNIAKLLSVSLVLTAAIGSAAVVTAEEMPKSESLKTSENDSESEGKESGSVIYLNLGAGSDSADGKSASAAVGSVAKALELMDGRATVIICGSVLPDSTQQATLKSAGAYLVMPSSDKTSEDEENVTGESDEQTGEQIQETAEDPQVNAEGEDSLTESSDITDADAEAGEIPAEDTQVYLFEGLTENEGSEEVTADTTGEMELTGFEETENLAVVEPTVVWSSLTGAGDLVLATTSGTITATSVTETSASSDGTGSQSSLMSLPGTNIVGNGTNTSGTSTSGTTSSGNTSSGTSNSTASTVSSTVSVNNASTGTSALKATAVSTGDFNKTYVYIASLTTAFGCMLVFIKLQLESVRNAKKRTYLEELADFHANCRI